MAALVAARNGPVAAPLRPMSCKLLSDNGLWRFRQDFAKMWERDGALSVALRCADSARLNYLKTGLLKTRSPHGRVNREAGNGFITSAVFVTGDIF
jgi:hypothetical protein